MLYHHCLAINCCQSHLSEMLKCATFTVIHQFSCHYFLVGLTKLFFYFCVIKKNKYKQCILNK
jgi:hypothetical protein